MAFRQDIDEDKMQNKKVEQAICIVKNILYKVLSVLDQRGKEHYSEPFGHTQMRARPSEQQTLWMSKFCLMEIYKLPWNLPAKHLSEI